MLKAYGIQNQYMVRGWRVCERERSKEEDQVPIRRRTAKEPEVNDCGLNSIECDGVGGGGWSFELQGYSG